MPDRGGDAVFSFFSFGIYDCDREMIFYSFPDVFAFLSNAIPMEAVNNFIMIVFPKAYYGLSVSVFPD